MYKTFYQQSIWQNGMQLLKKIYSLTTKIRVLYISRGEIEETRSHLLVAHQLQFITDQAYFELEKSYNQLCKDLNSYIIDLNKKNINS